MLEALILQAVSSARSSHFTYVYYMINKVSKLAWVTRAKGARRTSRGDQMAGDANKGIAGCKRIVAVNVKFQKAVSVRAQIVCGDVDGLAAHHPLRGNHQVQIGGSRGQPRLHLQARGFSRRNLNQSADEFNHQPLS